MIRASLPHEIPGRAATRLINEVRGIHPIVDDITSTPRHDRMGVGTAPSDARSNLWKLVSPDRVFSEISRLNDIQLLLLRF